MSSTVKHSSEKCILIKATKVIQSRAVSGFLFFFGLIDLY